MKPTQTPGLELDPIYIFRGTSKENFDLRILGLKLAGHDGIYVGNLKPNQDVQDGITYTSKDILVASSIAKTRARECFIRDEPLLLAIDVRNYLGRLNLSKVNLGEMEVGIQGPISLDDIVIIDSIEKVKKFCPPRYHSFLEREFCYLKTA